MVDKYVVNVRVDFYCCKIIFWRDDMVFIIRTGKSYFAGLG